MIRFNERTGEFEEVSIVSSQSNRHYSSRIIREKAISIIVDKLGVDRSEVTESASFVNDFGADSLDVVELIMEFEKEFCISIPDNDVLKISTVGDVISYLQHHVK